MTADSPNADVVEGQVPETVADDAPDVTSESSTEEGGKRTLFEAVMEAVDYGKSPDGEEDAGESPTPQAQEGESADARTPAEAEDGEDDLADLSDEDRKGLKPRTARRIERLLEARKQDQHRIRELEVSAGEFQKVDSFLRSNNLSPQQAAEALQMAALVQGAREGRVDANTALQAVSRIQQGLLRMTGHVLPPDLKKKVDDGFLDKTSAREVARARVEADRARSVRQQSTAVVQQTQAQQAQVAIRSAVEGWERQTAAADPDYGQMAALVQTQARALMQQYGQPRNPTEAIQLLNRAHQDARALRSSLAPRPAPTPTRPASDTAVAGSTRPLPKSLFDAVEQAANGASSA